MAHQEDKKLNLVLVCGAWGGGTTAVAGMLSMLGMPSIPPYLATNDDRTKNSFESIAFREVVDQLASMETLSVTANKEARLQKIQAFSDYLAKHDALKDRDGGVKPFFLKYPLSAMIINEICAVFNTRLIYVIRPLEAIERSRVRRAWFEQLGQKGAKVLYSSMFSAFIGSNVPTLMLRYNEILKDPEACANNLVAFTNLKPTDNQIEQAAAFLNRKSS